MIKQTIAEELRAKKSRDNRELLDRAADYIETLEREKAEVAGEIFSEILNIIRGYSHSACIAKNNYGITQVEYIGTDILKLKKKYTEGPDNAVQT